MLGYGFVRAIVMNRRPQIIVADLVVPTGCAELAEAVMFSPVVRQYVQRQIEDQRAQVRRIGRTMHFPATGEPAVQRDADVLVKQIIDSIGLTELRAVAYDSSAALLAALRGVAPDAADRFLGLFSVILPPPRGWSVSLALIQRGTAVGQRVGVSVEVVRLDGRPIASEIFWEPLSALSTTPVAQPGSTERVLSLMEPVTCWIALRLVTVMVSPRRGRQGLQRLLAGLLFLAAMRDFPDQALTFGEQACAELEQARRLLPGFSFPITTLASVYERMGWAHQVVGHSVQASDCFTTAARLWKEAENVTRDSTETGEAELAVLVDRRLKAQLESGDPALCSAALAELNSVPAPAELLTNGIWLYNRACLYAQASKVDPGTDYQQRALLWLGLALMRYRDSSLWDYAAQRDPELEPIRPILGPFLICLRNLMPDNSVQFNHGDAEVLVKQAISSASSQC